MPDPGQVYYLPPEAREGLNKGDRPHVALSLRAPRVETSTLAYGSTKATDALRGAAHVLVEPRPGGPGGTGLSRSTYFYPSRLLTFAVGDLPEPAGRVIDELPRFREQVRRALGLGQGVTREANARGTNRRGRIAEYAPSVSRDLDATHCLVVTEAEYSRTGLQQITIPLLNAMEYHAAPGDVLVQNPSDWDGRFALRHRSLLIAVPLVTTVHERDSIARYTRTIVSEGTMLEVEASLALHFGL